tara:strand:- start:373056 stop:373436 length:381 start_codon:yes stop_codon:yes gene_type:complete
MKSKMFAIVGLSAVISASLLSGCATSSEKPTRQLSRAESYIEVAQNEGAQQYSGAALQQARDKLAQASRAAEKGDHEVAQRLAKESELDAQYAAARTARMKAQQSLEEVQSSLETLRQETTRNSIN